MPSYAAPVASASPRPRRSADARPSSLSSGFSARIGRLDRVARSYVCRLPPRDDDVREDLVLQRSMTRAGKIGSAMNVTKANPIVGVRQRVGSSPLLAERRFDLCGACSTVSAGRSHELLFALRDGREHARPRECGGRPHRRVVQPTVPPSHGTRARRTAGGAQRPARSRRSLLEQSRAEVLLGLAIRRAAAQGSAELRAFRRRGARRGRGRQNLSAGSDGIRDAARDRLGESPRARDDVELFSRHSRSNPRPSKPRHDVRACDSITGAPLDAAAREEHLVGVTGRWVAPIQPHHALDAPSRRPSRAATRVVRYAQR